MRESRTGEGAPYGTGRVCNKLSDTDAAYIAGLIDGEGTIGMVTRTPGARAGRFTLHVAINITNREVLEWLNEVSGIGAVLGPYVYTRNRNAFYRWSAISSGAASVIEQIRPFLKIKVGNADLLLRVHATLLADRERMKDAEWLCKVKEAFHQLNAKGPVNKDWAGSDLIIFERGRARFAA